MNRPHWLKSFALIAAVVAIGSSLFAWKHAALAQADADAAAQPEPAQSVAVAVAREHEHRQTTTAIGTIVALRSITLRNETPGTVRTVSLAPGRIVEAGALLAALDVSVEQAELAALEAQAVLAETQYARMQRMVGQRAASEMEVDSARAQRDIAVAQIARTRAVIERKMIRAPFRARVGISDVHPGQYLNEGALLTTLQGVDDAVYVDFTVAQQVAARLRKGDQIAVLTRGDDGAQTAVVLAIDARVDPATRNAAVRAELRNAKNLPAPGASVRVQVPVAAARMAVAIPASALRKGPGGDHVFVIAGNKESGTRAHVREVQVFGMTGDEVLIKEGLAAGERVAASGSFKLHEAALVAIIGEAESVALAAPADAASAGASF